MKDSRSVGVGLGRRTVQARKGPFDKTLSGGFQGDRMIGIHHFYPPVKGFEGSFPPPFWMGRCIFTSLMEALPRSLIVMSHDTTFGCSRLHLRSGLQCSLHCESASRRDKAEAVL